MAGKGFGQVDHGQPGPGGRVMHHPAQVLADEIMGKEPGETVMRGDIDDHQPPAPALRDPGRAVQQRRIVGVRRHRLGIMQPQHLRGVGQRQIVAQHRLAAEQFFDRGGALRPPPGDDRTGVLQVGRGPAGRAEIRMGVHRPGKPACLRLVLQVFPVVALEKGHQRDGRAEHGPVAAQDRKLEQGAGAAAAGVDHRPRHASAQLPDHAGAVGQAEALDE